MARAVAELGYDITVQDLEMMVADLQELDEEELAAVAGGNVIIGEGLPVFDGDNDRDGREAWCVAYWHCYTALMHTEGGTTDEKCLKNYACFLAYN